MNHLTTNQIPILLYMYQDLLHSGRLFEGNETVRVIDNNNGTDYKITL